MHSSLLYLLPLLRPASATHLTAIPYGEAELVQTLVPWFSEAISHPINRTMETHPSMPIVSMTSQSITKMQRLREAVRLQDQEAEEKASSLHDNHGHSEMKPSTEVLPKKGMTNETVEPMSTSKIARRNKIIGISEAASYPNKMQVDCLRGPEICNQVCWYQNCVAGDSGEIQYPEYEIGFDAKRDKSRSLEDAAKNRLKSGVKTSRGPPCKNWPMGQKFWDTYPFEEKFDFLKEEDDTADSTQDLGLVSSLTYSQNKTLINTSAVCFIAAIANA